MTLIPHENLGWIGEQNDFVQYGAALSDLNLRTATATGGTVSRQSQDGGRLRVALTAAETGAGSAATATAYQPRHSNGPIIATARVRASDVSKASMFVGLSDANNDSVVIENENGTLNTVATDAVGFLLEGEQDLTWQAIGVNNDVDKSLVALTDLEDAVDNEYVWLRVQVSANGAVEWFGGVDAASMKLLHREEKEYIRSNIDYCFIFSADARNSAYNAEMDYYSIYMPRPSRNI